MCSIIPEMRGFIWKILCISIAITVTMAVRPTPFKGYLRGLTVPTKRIPCKLRDDYELYRRRMINRWVWEGEEEDRKIKLAEAKLEAKRNAAKLKAQRKIDQENAKRKAEQLEIKRKAEESEAKRKADQLEAKRKADRLEATAKANRLEAKRKTDQAEAVRLSKLRGKPMAKARPVSLLSALSEEEIDLFDDFYDIIF